MTLMRHFFFSSQLAPETILTLPKLKVYFGLPPNRGHDAIKSSSAGNSREWLKGLK
jgi:hypothetical protein